MNNDLNSLILSNARERVANEKGFKDWKSLDYMNQGSYVAQATEQAALLSMEELAGFYEDIVHRVNEGLLYYSPWIGNEKDYRKDYLTITDEKEIRFSITELYTQYLNEKKDEGEDLKIHSATTVPDENGLYYSYDKDGNIILTSTDGVHWTKRKN